MLADFAVGAYLSDKAVVFYGQPVISLDATMRIMDAATNSPVSFIDQNATEVYVEVCFRYSYFRCTMMGTYLTICILYY